MRTHIFTYAVFERRWLVVLVRLLFRLRIIFACGVTIGEDEPMNARKFIHAVDIVCACIICFENDKSAKWPSVK